MVKQVHGVVTIENFLQIKKKSGPSCMQFLVNLLKKTTEIIFSNMMPLKVTF